MFQDRLIILRLKRMILMALTDASMPKKLGCLISDKTSAGYLQWWEQQKRIILIIRQIQTSEEYHHGA